MQVPILYTNTFLFPSSSRCCHEHLMRQIQFPQSSFPRVSPLVHMVKVRIRILCMQTKQKTRRNWICHNSAPSSQSTHRRNPIKTLSFINSKKQGLFFIFSAQLFYRRWQLIFYCWFAFVGQWRQLRRPPHFLGRAQYIWGAVWSLLPWGWRSEWSGSTIVSRPQAVHCWALSRCGSRWWWGGTAGRSGCPSRWLSHLSSLRLVWSFPWLSVPVVKVANLSHKAKR